VFLITLRIIISMFYPLPAYRGSLKSKLSSVTYAALVIYLTLLYRSLYLARNRKSLRLYLRLTINSLVK
jgi:hypothetical protein